MAKFRVKQQRLVLKAASNRLLAAAELLIGAFGKGVTAIDLAAIADAIAILFGKQPVDTVDSSDSARLDVAKAEQESVASIDQAILSSGKSISDSSEITDVAARSFSKSLSDSVSLADALIASISQDTPLDDSSSMSDQANVTFGKRPVETISFTESQAFAFGKGINDTVYATDDIGAEATIDDDQTLQVQKRLIELPSITDIVSRVAEYARQFSDSSSASDVFTRQVGYSRDFTESPTASETVIISSGINRTASDSASLLDQAVALVGKRPSDIMNSTDSGVLLNQDYVDNNLYFADDYVGLKRIF